jgi:hypothetical protein
VVASANNNNNNNRNWNKHKNKTTKITLHNIRQLLGSGLGQVFSKETA